MGTTKSLRSAAILCRLTPQEHENIRRKAAAYTARTGKPLTLSEVLRIGAAEYLDELLRDTDDLDVPTHA